MGGSTSNKRIQVKDTPRPRNFHFDAATFEAVDAIAAHHFTERTAASRYSIHATADNLAKLKPKKADFVETGKMERKQIYLPDSDMKLLEKIARAIRSAGALEDLNISAALRYAIRRTAKQCQQRT